MYTHINFNINNLITSFWFSLLVITLVAENVIAIQSGPRQTLPFPFGEQSQLQPTSAAHHRPKAVEPRAVEPKAVDPCDTCDGNFKILRQQFERDKGQCASSLSSANDLNRDIQEELSLYESASNTVFVEVGTLMNITSIMSSTVSNSNQCKSDGIPLIPTPKQLCRPIPVSEGYDYDSCIWSSRIVDTNHFIIAECARKDNLPICVEEGFDYNDICGGENKFRGEIIPHTMFDSFSKVAVCCKIGNWRETRRKCEVLNYSGNIANGILCTPK